MSNFSVKVVGTGGIGSCLLPILTRLLNYKNANYSQLLKKSVVLTLIDGDTFENKNRERQGVVGGFKLANKAIVLAEALQKDFTNIKIETFTQYVTEANASKVFAEDDLILMCVDNHKTRKLVTDYCATLNNVTLISAGNDFVDGDVHWYVRENGADVTPPLTKVFKKIANPTDKHPNELKKLGCGEVVQSAPQLLVVNNMAAALMLGAVHRYLQGSLAKEKATTAAHDLVYFDIDSGKSRTVKNEV